MPRALLEFVRALHLNGRALLEFIRPLFEFVKDSTDVQNRVIPNCL
jgi:hypothetical protein